MLNAQALLKKSFSVIKIAITLIWGFIMSGMHLAGQQMIKNKKNELPQAKKKVPNNLQSISNKPQNPNNNMLQRLKEKWLSISIKKKKTLPLDPPLNHNQTIQPTASVADSLSANDNGEITGAVLVPKEMGEASSSYSQNTSPSSSSYASDADQSSSSLFSDLHRGYAGTPPESEQDISDFSSSSSSSNESFLLGKKIKPFNDCDTLNYESSEFSDEADENKISQTIHITNEEILARWEFDNLPYIFTPDLFTSDAFNKKIKPRNEFNILNDESSASSSELDKNKISPRIRLTNEEILARWESDNLPDTLNVDTFNPDTFNLLSNELVLKILKMHATSAAKVSQSDVSSSSNMSGTATRRSADFYRQQHAALLAIRKTSQRVNALYFSKGLQLELLLEAFKFEVPLPAELPLAITELFNNINTRNDYSLRIKQIYGDLKRALKIRDDVIAALSTNKENNSQSNEEIDAVINKLTASISSLDLLAVKLPDDGLFVRSKHSNSQDWLTAVHLLEKKLPASMHPPLRRSLLNHFKDISKDISPKTGGIWAVEYLLAIDCFGLLGPPKMWRTLSRMREKEFAFAGFFQEIRENLNVTISFPLLRLVLDYLIDEQAQTVSESSVEKPAPNATSPSNKLARRLTKEFHAVAFYRDDPKTIAKNNARRDSLDKAEQSASEAKQTQIINAYKGFFAHKLNKSDSSPAPMPLALSINIRN